MTLEDSVRRHRLAILQRAALLGSVTQACREAGISRTLYYRWRQRIRERCRTRPLQGRAGVRLPCALRPKSSRFDGVAGVRGTHPTKGVRKPKMEPLTCPSGRWKMRCSAVLMRRYRVGLVSVLAFVALMVGALPVGAAVSGRGPTFTVSMTTLSPLVALIAGILILVVPRLLNLIVAAYLIIFGLIGFFGR